MEQVKPAPAPQAPEAETIRQAELKACMDISNAVEEIAAGFARRMLAGAAVEPGEHYAVFDGEPHAQADELGSINVGGLDIGLETAEHQEHMSRLRLIESGQAEGE